eukprot:TRINITY_DN80563_c0_g1_i1.p1 TRINITY_DN80563_c0_g1~~TRINITY_DN80563_c0_g1_i1.p1  ORF type:complete len:279 (-),score=26.59 TRINITY_DN80563_c0_g1_i1:20-826(-)
MLASKSVPTPTVRTRAVNLQRHASKPRPILLRPPNWLAAPTAVLMGMCTLGRGVRHRTFVALQSQSDGERRRPGLIGFSNAITATVILTMSLLQVVRRDVAPLCTLGVIVANVITKALKLGVRQTLPASLWQRPAGSSRDSRDPGFPSSHTSIMTFVSVYFALYLWLHLGLPCATAAFVAIVPSALMACARICDRDHTPAQTLGGLVWGCSLGLWWALIGPRLRGILEWAEPQPWAMVVLCFAVGLPMFTKPLTRTKSLEKRSMASAL